MLDRLRIWARSLKRDATALWIAARDPRTPRLAKLVALATAAYAFSSIDLIPDFVPVLGLLDDLILVPAGLWLALRLIPAPLMAEFREQATVQTRPISRMAASIVIAIWILAASACLWAVTAL
jgi:uncharacterized membrane protein YkvA (DUF1232 family)